MQLLKQFLLFWLLLTTGFFTKANTVDSLLTALPQSHDTTKIKIYYRLSLHYRKSSEDSAIFYLKKMVSVADSLFLEYKKDTTQSKYLFFVKGAYHNANNDYNYKFERFDDLLKLSTKELKIARFINDSSWLGKIYNTIGNIYKFRSDYDTALVYYQKYLDIKREMGNKQGVAYAYIGIANVFINWKKYPEALKNYKLCQKYAKEIQDTSGLAAASVGMGNVYSQTGNLPLALTAYKNAYKYYKLVKDTEGIALALNSLGDLYGETKEYDKSKEKYQEALNLMLKKDIKIRVALIYHQLGNVATAQKDYPHAINYFKESLKYSLLTNYKKITLPNYQGLANCYYHLGKYKLAYDYLEKFHNLNDSIFNEEKHKQLTEIETKYQTAQKEKIIKQQKFKIEKEKIINDKRTAQRNFVIIGLILLLGLLFFVFRSYRIKKKSNQILIKQKALIQEQNEELNQQAEELRVLNESLNQQNEKISTQRDEIEEQKNKIEIIHQEVSESIDYAKRLQFAILSSEEVLQSLVSDHFVFFRPKDKVSGDFYWWTHIEGHTVITVADCTGHGVPGAFMSMLGVSFLREIVIKEYITHPGVILRRLRKEIIKALDQKGESGEQKDGMDMAIISIDHETNTVQFSGANNPLYIIKPVIARRNDEAISPNNEQIATPSARNDDKNEQIASGLALAMTNNDYGLYEIKPDKMPIAIYERMDKFTTHEFKVEKDDQLYLFSDGFADQFGGPKGKKFKYKPFKQLIIHNCQLTMTEQKEILERTFNGWIEGYEQVDDITVVGIKL